MLQDHKHVLHWHNDCMSDLVVNSSLVHDPQSHNQDSSCHIVTNKPLLHPEKVGPHNYIVSMWQMTNNAPHCQQLLREQAGGWSAAISLGL